MRNKGSTYWKAITGITLLAAALRFPLLGKLPPGLYHDEAINGLDALRVLDGVTPVFFTANNGREPLFIYLVAGAIALLGRSALAVRLVSAALGTLTVPATYLLGQRLFDRRIGLLTAAITAITVWPINLSRVGFRAAAMPLFAALTVWAFWRGYERRTTRGATDWPWFALAGLFAGLTLYTYLAARFLPIVFPTFISYLALAHKFPNPKSQIPNPKSQIPNPKSQIPNPKSQIPWRGLLLFAGAAIIVAAPLLGYFATHRAAALQRAFQVSILNPDINAGDPLGTLARHLGRTLLMFNVRGDFIPRHNVPRRPVFDPLLSPFFLLGLGVALRRWRQPAYTFALIWTAVMLLPTVLAEDAPHFLRAAGVLPILFVFPAIGLSTAADWLKQRYHPLSPSPPPPFTPPLPHLVVAGVLAISLSLTTYDYFVRHARSQNTYYQFETGASELARDVNQFLKENPTGQVYIDQTLWNGWASIRFLVGSQQKNLQSPISNPQSPISNPQSPISNLQSPISNLQSPISNPQPPTPNLQSPISNLQSPTHVLLALWPFQDLSRYYNLLPPDSTISVREGAKERGDLEPEARLLYVLFRAAPHSDAGPPLARFGDSITLQAADVEPLPDGRLRVRLVWADRPPVATDYTATVQLLGPAGLITQNDGPLARGYYPTTAWRPGDRVIDQRVLEPPAPYAPDSQQIIVALYDPKTLERLPVTTLEGRLLGDHYTLPAP